jgi:flagellar biosynthesis/type III secretory pathway chaperone
LNQTVEKLKGILAQELEVYNKLFGLAQEKKKLLLEKFSTDLQKIVGQEELLVQQLIDLEPQRRECVKQITGDPDASLDAAVETVPESDGKSDLWMIGSQLKDRVLEIKKVNDENQNLLEQALELTEYSIKLITRVPGDVTYGSAGKQKTGKRPGLSIFDRIA